MKEIEEFLLEVFASPKGKMKKWLRKKLREMRVEEEFIKSIVRFEKADKRLLKFSAREINQTIELFIQEYREHPPLKHLERKAILANPGKLRIFKKKGLGPFITPETILRFKPETLLKNKRLREKQGLAVTPNTITRPPPEPTQIEAE
jgi:hypothetical protein